MPIDPKTGLWKEEDADVSTRLTGLLSKDNDYLKSAGTVARKESNRRGLLNSTMNTQAVEAARIGAALPIAQQEASQINQRNLQGYDVAAGERMQARGLEHETGMQTRDIASRESMQLKDIASREGMQQAELAYLTDSQIRDIASREGMQATELKAMLQRQQLDIASTERMQGTELDYRRWAADLDVGTRLQMQALDLEAQQRIANMNVATAERNQAASLAVAFETLYSSQLATIMNNLDIPAETRQTYMDHAASLRESYFGLLEQLFSFELDWAA